MAAISGDQFIDLRAAALLLGVTPGQVRWLSQRGRFVCKWSEDRFWVEKVSVEREAQRRASEKGRWISYDVAANLAGCSRGTIKAAVGRGEITNRPASRGSRGGKASLDVDSVKAFAKRWAHQKAETEAQRAAALARRPATAPPDDNQVWLTVGATALVLGLSASRVKQLAAADRLPHTRTGSRAWFLRQHVEQAAAARAFLHAQQLTRRRPSYKP